MIINNESLGVTAEKVICDLCGIESSELIGRSIPELEGTIKPYIEEALKKLPLIVKYVGQERGGIGGQSKSPIDFYFEDGKSLSVKTNKTGKKVCPSRCGQPGNETFDKYFRHLYDNPNDTITYDKFKKLALEKTHLMIPIYLENTFDCDYLLWLYYQPKRVEYKVIKKEDVSFFEWKKEKFTFTQTIESWNESCTVKYNGITLGEYQVHKHRKNFKFRFNFDKLGSFLGV
ncbi:MAG: hypothetical protein JW804_04150 [Sedimentisphaerales bacterium]|nr:hypothetical protein [Sedimentisphaerales bacterium]